MIPSCHSPSSNCIITSYDGGIDFCEFIIKRLSLTFSSGGKKGVFVRVVNQSSHGEDPMDVTRTNKLTETLSRKLYVRWIIQRHDS